MTVLVTGGSGVVGTAIVRRLVAEGRDVRVLARSESADEIVDLLGATAIRGDLLDPSSLAAAVDGCELIFHVGGKVEFCSKDASSMFDVNVGGTRNLIDAARRAGARRVVHTSSAVTLGEQPGTFGLESTVHRGAYLTRYEASKCEAEAIALDASKRGNLEIVVVNPSSVQGPGRSSGTGRILLDAVNGKLPMMFDVPFSIVDVDDCASGHLLAATNGRSGERYVLSGFTLSARDGLNLLAELIGRPTSVRVLPTWTLRPLGPVANVVGRFVKSVPICAESIRQMRSGARYDGSRASRELGLEYRSPRETFTRLLEWFRAEGLTER